MTGDDKRFIAVLFTMVFFMGLVIGMVYMVTSDHHNAESIINVERFDLTLLSDEDDARVVSGNFLFLIDKRVPVTVGGDIANETMSKRDFYSSAGNATIVRGTDLFVLNEPAESGDEVEIMIWHGINKTAVTVILEAAA